MTVRRFPKGCHATGSHCWRAMTYLPAHVMSHEVDGTRHARGYYDCEVGS